jgi:penicillin-binding protein 2
VNERTVADRASGRLFVLGAVVIAMVLALIGRLWFLQVASGDSYAVAAITNATREIVTPATRGLILDDQGRTFIDNDTALVVSVDRTVLERMKSKPRRAVLERLSPIVEKDADDIWNEIQVCGPQHPKPCWNGGQYQPVPVAAFPTVDVGGKKVDPDLLNRRVLAIQENAKDFPGIGVDLQAVRNYPQTGVVRGTTLAAHLLGYLSPLSAEDKKNNPVVKADLRSRDGRPRRYTDSSQLGREGLEQTYDEQLRGVDGVTSIAVNAKGQPARTLGVTEPVAGNDLVLNLDAAIQRGAEQALQNALNKYARANGKSPTVASAVVMTTDGRVVALASTPSYDPTLFTGGISAKSYAALASDANHKPALDRAVNEVYQPGSSWKPIMTAGILGNKIATQGSYTPCGSEFATGNVKLRNFEGESSGPLTFAQALEISCNTVFYRYGYDEWVRDGGLRTTASTKARTPHEYLVNTAKAFGFGSRTGIDLPSEARGTIVDRARQTAIYKELKPRYCSDAQRLTGLFQKFAQEACVDGYLYRGGDATKFAIGQGAFIAVTPLQMARAYAAIANGGTLYAPTLAKAVVRPDGSVVSTITPEATGKVPVPAADLSYIRQALRLVTHGSKGTASGVFSSYPIDVSGKTGTVEVQHFDAAGKEQPSTDTSWFASYAPSDKPKYVVVVNVPDSDQGAKVAAPAVRDIYDVIFGVRDGVLKPNLAVAPGGKPPVLLPCFNQSNGRITPPNSRCPSASPPTAAGVTVSPGSPAPPLPAIGPEGSVLAPPVTRRRP